RGLPRGSSLARLLAAERGRKHGLTAPSLSVAQILTWAEAYHARERRWPHRKSGAIPGAPGRTWHAVDMALRHGYRGFEGGSSLAQLLREQGRVTRRQTRPELSLEEVLGWAEAYRARHGRWPHNKSGPVEDAPGETWGSIHVALFYGYRGLPSGT